MLPQCEEEQLIWHLSEISYTAQLSCMKMYKFIAAL